MHYETSCGGLIKILWFDGQGMCLFSKRLEKGHFQWPVTDTGRVSLTPAQLSMLLEGIDWRMPARVLCPGTGGLMPLFTPDEGADCDRGAEADCRTLRDRGGYPRQDRP